MLVSLYLQVRRLAISVDIVQNHICNRSVRVFLKLFNICVHLNMQFLNYYYLPFPVVDWLRLRLVIFESCS